MAYDYIARRYGRRFQIGQRIRHTVTGREGTVTRRRIDTHYLRVRFDGDRRPRNVYPPEAEILSEEK
ncbi:MAG: hypothetical protein AAGI34_09595 [Pseudomonadota bacterium]